MISRKEIQQHINEALYIDHLQLECCIEWIDSETKIARIKGREGIDKTFKTNKAAKSFITKLNNKILCDRVDNMMGLNQCA